jgi:hypothetical protein
MLIDTVFIDKRLIKGSLKIIKMGSRNNPNQRSGCATAFFGTILAGSLAVGLVIGPGIMDKLQGLERFKSWVEGNPAPEDAERQVSGIGGEGSIMQEATEVFVTVDDPEVIRKELEVNGAAVTGTQVFDFYGAGDEAYQRDFHAVVGRGVNGAWNQITRGLIPKTGYDSVSTVMKRTVDLEPVVYGHVYDGQYDITLSERDLRNGNATLTVGVTGVTVDDLLVDLEKKVKYDKPIDDPKWRSEYIMPWLYPEDYGLPNELELAQNAFAHGRLQVFDSDNDHLDPLVGSVTCAAAFRAAESFISTINYYEAPLNGGRTASFDVEFDFSHQYANKPGIPVTPGECVSFVQTHVDSGNALDLAATAADGWGAQTGVGSGVGAEPVSFELESKKKVDNTGAWEEYLVTMLEVSELED